ncbi:MAG: MFS transporter [Actinomycetota bacterium]
MNLPVFGPSLLFVIGEGALLPIIPATAQLLGASLSAAGIITGLVMIGTLLADIPAASLINRIGERKSMIWAAFAGAVGVLISVLATNLWVLGIGFFILGATVAVFALARHSYLTETVPYSHRARALSILGGVFRAGHFFGPMLGALIITLFDVHAVYWVAVVMCAFAAILLIFTKPESMPDTPSTLKGATWQVAKQESKKLATLGIASAIMGGLRTARIVGLPLWALHIGLSPATTALFIGIAGALDLALSYTSGQIMDRYGRRWSAIPTLVGLSFTFSLLTIALDGTTFLTVALLMSLANGVGSGVILVIGADLAPEGKRNEFLASYRLLVDGGVALAPVVLSSFTAIFGLASAMFALSGIGLIGAAIAHRYLPRRAKPSEQTLPVSENT